MTQVRFCDEVEFGFGWIADEPLRRTSHALAADGGVWIVDPIEGPPGIDGRIAALGEPRAVIQLLDRHRRASAAYAERLGVPLLEVPFAGMPGSPFDVVRVVNLPVWREVALWWPERRVLVCADALGTRGYFRAGVEGPVGVHPLLRPFPPRRLAEVEPLHVLTGHGEGVHGDDAAPAVRAAVAGARRGLPAAVAAMLRLGRRSR